ncbi:MAG: hypothetical protein NC305_05300 [Lachnospiraceae bacterium]|nr:hypothetical protein [Lachnospiraceae bacterium]MCM1303123.1 hypothetical protein [Butyrivibrio sp.]MCM1342792.1 hypothetical protein [Muribaculaceae bacterium]MCM1409944.1 hypothetical protein [Lachnospiraceae bacterium]
MEKIKEIMYNHINSGIGPVRCLPQTRYAQKQRRKGVKDEISGYAL